MCSYRGFGNVNKLASAAGGSEWNAGVRDQPAPSRLFSRSSKRSNLHNLLSVHLRTERETAAGLITITIYIFAYEMSEHNADFVSIATWLMVTG